MFDFPASPSVDQSYTAHGVTFKYNGYGWLVTGTSGVTSGTISVGDVPPIASDNTLWFESDTGVLWFRFNDGNTSQWVSVGGPSVPLSDVNASLNNVGRNLIHNSMMNVRQRGTGPWTSTYTYTADRWFENSATDTVSFVLTTVNDTERSQIGHEDVDLILRNTWTGSSAAGAFNYISQKMEGVRRLAGKTVVISFYANSGSPVKLGISLYQSFGTGGSPSAGAFCPGATYITTLAGVAWGRFYVTMAVPSVAGKTLGTNNDDYTQLSICYSSGTTNDAAFGSPGVQSGIVNIWGVQVEIAQTNPAIPTPLEKIDRQQDLAKCQRFYQTGHFSMRGYYPGSDYMSCSIPFPVVMRAVPAIVIGTATSNINVNSGGYVDTYYVHGLRFAVQTTAVGMAELRNTFTASADL